MWRRLDSAQAHGHGLRSWRAVRFRLGLAVGRFRVLRAGRLFDLPAPIRPSNLLSEAGRLKAVARSLCGRGAGAGAVRTGYREVPARAERTASRRSAAHETRLARTRSRRESQLAASAKPRPVRFSRLPCRPGLGHKRKRPRRGGAVCRSGSSARGRGAAWISRRPWTGRRRRPLRPRPIPGLRVPCARARPSRPRRCIPG